METKKNQGRARPAVLAMILAMLGCFALGQALQTPKASAQNVATGQMLASGSVSISAGTPATIVTGTTGKKVVVTAMRLATVSTGGTVTFYDGNHTTASVADGTALFTAYVPASTSVNNNVEVSSFFLGNAWPTLAGIVTTSATAPVYGTSGNSLCAQLNGCTLVYEICYYFN